MISATDVINFKVIDGRGPCKRCGTLPGAVLLKKEPFCLWCALLAATGFIPLREEKSALSFNRLTLHEPRLVPLKSEIVGLAASVSNDDKFCANYHWYKTFKPKLLKLVGYDRTDLGEGHILRSSQAYSAALHHLYNLLPDCNHEGGACGRYE